MQYQIEKDYLDYRAKVTEKLLWFLYQKVCTLIVSNTTDKLLEIKVDLTRYSLSLKL
jgi:hypothetical protein